MVLSGRVQIAAATGGIDLVLATIGSRDFFGEMAVVDDGPRSATARAETATRTCFVKRQKLLDLLERQPRLDLRIIREFSNRMRKLSQKYADEIIQAERLAVVGRFASPIVRDFKTPSVIDLATDLACSRGTRFPIRRQARGDNDEADAADDDDAAGTD